MVVEGLPKCFDTIGKYETLSRSDFSASISKHCFTLRWSNICSNIEIQSVQAKNKKSIAMMETQNTGNSWCMKSSNRNIYNCFFIQEGQRKIVNDHHKWQAKIHPKPIVLLPIKPWWSWITLSSIRHDSAKCNWYNQKRDTNWFNCRL